MLGSVATLAVSTMRRAAPEAATSKGNNMNTCIVKRGIVGLTTAVLVSGVWVWPL